MKTPGPWYEARTGNHQGLICSDGGANVAVAYDKEDAALIAAAPELLEALEGILDAVNVRIDDPRIKAFNAARSIIGRAKGN